MAQLKEILKRLKNPTVIISIASQVLTILILLNVDIDKDWIIRIITAVCSILTLLGILSNPTSLNKGYGDDIYYCQRCGRDCVHVKVDGKMVCNCCGTVSEEATQRCCPKGKK